MQLLLRYIRLRHPQKNRPTIVEPMGQQTSVALTIKFQIEWMQQVKVIQHYLLPLPLPLTAHCPQHACYSSSLLLFWSPNTPDLCVRGRVSLSLTGCINSHRPSNAGSTWHFSINWHAFASESNVPQAPICRFEMNMHYLPHLKITYWLPLPDCPLDHCTVRCTIP